MEQGRHSRLLGRGHPERAREGSEKPDGLGTIDAALRELVRDVVREELRSLLEHPVVQPGEEERQPTGTDEYCSLKRAAELADVHPATIRTWIREGHLIGYRAGTSLRIKRRELDAYLARGIRQPSPPVDLDERAADILARSRR